MSAFNTDKSFQPIFADLAKIQSGFNKPEDSVIIKNQSFSAVSFKKEANQKVNPNFFKKETVITPPYKFVNSNNRPNNFTKQADAIVEAYEKKAYRENIDENIGDGAVKNPFTK